MEKEITLEQVEEFYRFLQGETPAMFTLQNQPKLSSEEAFTVIYILQELLGVFPDHYERCRVCGDLFDSQIEGLVIDEGEEHLGEIGDYCDLCAPYPPEEDEDDEDGE